MVLHKLFSILTILLITASVNSQVIELNSQFESIDLGRHVEYYEDQSNSLQPEQFGNIQFTSTTSHSINWGYTSSTYWLRTRIVNNTQTPISFYLHNNNHYLEHFNISIQENNRAPRSFQLGSESKNKPHPIPITLEAGEQLNVLIEARSNSVLRIPIYLFSHEALGKYKRTKHILAGVFIGIFLFLIGLSVFIAIALKGRIYMIFGLFILFYSLYYIGSENFVPKIFLFGRYDFFLRTTVALIPAIQFCYIYFSKLFFDLRGKIKWIQRVFVFMLSITAINFLLFPLNYYLANRLLFYIPSIFGFTLFAISIYVWLKLKQVFLRFYVLATFLFIVGVTLHNLSNSGTIEHPFLAFNSIKISYILLLTIFSYALTDRFLLFSRNFTNILNEKVEERTTELEQAMFDLKKKQQQLIHSEKMATVGVLTAGLAHELNNPLNFINGGIQLIKSRNEEKELIRDEEILSSLGYIENGFERATSIVSSILEFSDGKTGAPTKQNIIDIIERTINVLKPKINDKISIQKNYNSNIDVVIDSSKMHQAFLGIFDNAVYYALQSQSKPIIKIEVLSKISYCQISISNNGPSIPEDTLPRIFDPFFTTKDVGEGTGLGLSSVLAIIQEQNGSIEVTNMNNEVCFVIKLPTGTENTRQ